MQKNFLDVLSTAIVKLVSDMVGGKRTPDTDETRRNFLKKSGLFLGVGGVNPGAVINALVPDSPEITEKKYALFEMMDLFICNRGRTAPYLKQSLALMRVELDNLFTSKAPIYQIINLINNSQLFDAFGKDSLYFARETVQEFHEKLGFSDAENKKLFEDYVSLSSSDIKAVYQEYLDFAAKTKVHVDYRQSPIKFDALKKEMRDFLNNGATLENYFGVEMSELHKELGVFKRVFIEKFKGYVSKTIAVEQRGFDENIIVAKRGDFTEGTSEYAVKFLPKNPNFTEKEKLVQYRNFAHLLNDFLGGTECLVTNPTVETIRDNVVGENIAIHHGLIFVMVKHGSVADTLFATLDQKFRDGTARLQ